jgi:hypothetical protein
VSRPTIITIAIAVEIASNSEGSSIGDNLEAAPRNDLLLCAKGLLRRAPLRLP